MIMLKSTWNKHKKIKEIKEDMKVTNDRVKYAFLLKYL